MRWPFTKGSTQGASKAVIAAVLLALASAPPALAQVYRWTDEHGRVHFSDKPPRDREAEDVSARTRAINVDESAQEREKLKALFAPETDEERRLNREQERQREARQQAFQQACDQARRDLRFFQEQRFYWVDEEGNSRNASERERQEQIKSLQDKIAEHC